MLNQQNKTCSGFVSCYHKDDIINSSNSSQYVKRQLLENWNDVTRDRYTIVEEASGMPVINQNNKFTVKWFNKSGFDVTKITHYSFWAVRRSLSGPTFSSHGSKAFVDVSCQYLITTKNENGVFCLSYSQYTDLISWIPLSSNVLGKEYDPTIVWKFSFVNKKDIAGYIREGDDVLLYSTYHPNKFISKSTKKCDFKSEPLFTLQDNNSVSVLINKFHGKGIYEESVPVCTFSDCDNECTLLNFQILGSNLSLNNTLTMQDNIGEVFTGYDTNPNTNLYSSIQGVGIFLIVLFSALVVILLYYRFVPREFDFISRVTVDDLYYNVKDLLTL